MVGRRRRSVDVDLTHKETVCSKLQDGATIKTKVCATGIKCPYIEIEA